MDPPPQLTEEIILKKRVIILLLDTNSILIIDMKPLLLTFALLFSTPTWAEVIYDGTIQISFLALSTGFLLDRMKTLVNQTLLFKKI